MDLHVLWFFILGALLGGYAVLDGFDLGVGILHLFVKTDHERRIFMGAIGPLWDGNEVWLVCLGGALMAAYPEAYATLTSGFYTVFMLVLLALICRAVSLEFRGKVHSPFWRSLWDTLFFLASLLATFLFGVGVGNTIAGVPLDAFGVYRGTFRALLNPYALTVGFLSVAMFAMHGAAFLVLKTTGDLQARVRQWVVYGYVSFALLYIAVTVMTVVTIPRAPNNLAQHPWAWIVMVLHLAVMGAIPAASRRRRDLALFLASGGTITALLFLFGLALYPNLVPSNPGAQNSLTIFNAASSEKTLGIIAIIAGIGMPFVLTYTAIVYKVF
ncbi:MAG: cytochrome d ubiquinol oxidase subunit II, partial [bacterium]|nr:cytochrome d ubiquinol oxidase subunit II [bacterium]